MEKIRSYAAIFSRSLRSFWQRAILRDLSHTARQLIILDFIFAGSLGLWLPIIALFLSRSIVGASPLIIATAISFFFLSKRLTQRAAPEFLTALGGKVTAIAFPFCMVIAVAPLAYLLIQNAFVLLGFQIIYGALCAFAFPIFAIVCAERTDAQNRTLWESYYAFNDFGCALFGIIGGLVATYAGFPFLIGLIVTFSVVGVLFLFPFYRHIERS